MDTISPPTRLDSIKEIASSQNLTFSEKVRMLKNEKSSEDRSPTNPKTLNRYTPWVFVYEILFIWFFGVLYIIPNLYGSYGIYTVLGMQMLSNFLSIQILMNWALMVNVDSYYDPKEHTLPAHIRDVKPPSREERQKMDDEHSAVKRSKDTIGKTKLYWTWNYCSRCDMLKPPRCHHCVLCNKCVLKRDHHCFFARQCVGYKNFRYFTIMIFWCTVGTTFALCHVIPYSYNEILKDGNYIDIIVPLTIIRWMFGYAEFFMIFYVSSVVLLVVFVIYSFTLSLGIWELIFNGKTMFEMENHIQIYDTRTARDKFQAVFGYYWPINFIMPQYRYKPTEDPLNFHSFKLKSCTSYLSLSPL